MIPKNALVSVIERPGAIDRYGVPVYETVDSRVWVRLEERTSTVRGSNGEETTIDATMFTDVNVDVQHLDRVTIDNVAKDRYIVFDVEDDLDLFAVSHGKIARLVKQKGIP